MACVYLLYSDKDQRWYIGCSDLAVHNRFDVHIAGKVPSTRHRRPLRLAYVENVDSFSAARKREWHLKHPVGFLEKKAITQKLLGKQELWPIEGPVI